VGETVFDINLNGNNVFDKSYLAYLSRLKSNGIANIGRNIVFGMNFGLKK
jgi:iron complex outermembrane receptor protein